MLPTYTISIVDGHHIVNMEPYGTENKTTYEIYSKDGEYIMSIDMDNVIEI